MVPYLSGGVYPGSWCLALAGKSPYFLLLAQVPLDPPHYYIMHCATSQAVNRAAPFVLYLCQELHLYFLDAQASLCSTHVH